MKFNIESLKYRNSSAPPCKNAVFDHEGSDAYFSRWFIEINTLEELLEIVKETTYDLIVNADTITIYDDYAE